MMEGVIVEETLMHQQGLHGIASGGVVSLGVEHNLDCLVQVAMLVQVSVANTISVTQNRDGLGSLLDGPVTRKCHHT